MVTNNTGPKIRAEQATIAIMVALYCRKNHRMPKNQLCEACSDLLQYAHRRLTLCRFGEEKTTFERCPKHCYRKDYKLRVLKVMRFSGPRMVLYHPILAMRHVHKNIKTKILSKRRVNQRIL